MRFWPTSIGRWDMSDLSARLRAYVAACDAVVEPGFIPMGLCADAADEIDRLTAETCDLTARVDLAQQERGIAEAERDKWKTKYDALKATAVYVEWEGIRDE